MGIRKSIRIKIILLFLLVGALPMLGSSLYLYKSSRQAIDTNTFHILEKLVDQTNDALQNTFQQANQVLLLTSHNPAFARYFYEPEKSQEWHKEIQKALGEIKGLFQGSLREACLIRRDGKELGKVVHGRILPTPDLDSDESDQTFFKAGLAVNRGEVFHGEPYFSEDAREWVIPFATPIVLPTGEKIALLHMEFGLSYLSEVLRERLWIRRGQIFIVEHQGRFLAHTGQIFHEESRLPDALQADPSTTWRTMIQDMMNGKAGFGQMMIQGHRSYFLFQPTFKTQFRDMGWTTGVIIPVDLVQVATDPLDYLVAGTLGSLLVLLLALWFGGKTSRPILALTKAISVIEQGKLNGRVNIQTEDEIGQLGQAFNRMARNLEASHQALIKKSNQLQVLYEAASALNSITSTEIIIKLLLDIARKVTDARYAAIGIFNEEGTIIRFHHAGLSPKQEEERKGRLSTPPQGLGILGALQREGRPIRLEDLSQDPRSAGFPPGHPPMKSFLGVPLRIRGKNLGNLYVTEKTNGQPFSEEDEALLVMIGRDASIALDNARLYEETRRLANTDSLSGLYNRRYFEEQLRKELDRSERYRRSFSLMILDINHFKQINDTHGHLAGDRALKIVAENLTKSIRAADVAARIGGDEFAVLLPETDQAGASQMAQRLKRQCAVKGFNTENGTSLPLEVSIGTATYPLDAVNIEDLIKSADQALYRDKSIHRRN